MALLLEDLPQVVHLAVVKLLLAERLIERHVRQFPFAVLDLEHCFFYTVLDHVADGDHVSLLTHPMLRNNDTLR